MASPVSNVAALIGQPVDSVIAKLSGAGISITSPAETLDQATNDDRDLEEKAVVALFPTQN